MTVHDVRRLVKGSRGTFKMVRHSANLKKVTGTWYCTSLHPMGMQKADWKKDGTCDILRVIPFYKDVLLDLTVQQNYRAAVKHAYEAHVHPFLHTHLLQYVRFVDSYLEEALTG